MRNRTESFVMRNGDVSDNNELGWLIKSKESLIRNRTELFMMRRNGNVPKELGSLNKSFKEEWGCVFSDEKWECVFAV